MVKSQKGFETNWLALSNMAGSFLN